MYSFVIYYIDTKRVYRFTCNVLPMPQVGVRQIRIWRQTWFLIPFTSSHFQTLSNSISHFTKVQTFRVNSCYTSFYLGNITWI